MPPKKVEDSKSVIKSMTKTAQVKARSTVVMPFHPYNTRGKSKALASQIKQYALSMEEKPLFEVMPQERDDLKLSFDNEDSYSSTGFSPAALKPSTTAISGTMTVMTTGTTSLEEQIASLTQTIQDLLKKKKEKDDFIVAVMTRIDNLTEVNQPP
ncbi:hypothetical protein SLA2020_013850 [Shorea laevis]